MDVDVIKKNKIKKLRLLTSILIIAISIILLIYALISDEPTIILVVLIIIVKILDHMLNLYKIRKRNINFNFKTSQN